MHIENLTLNQNIAPNYAKMVIKRGAFRRYFPSVFRSRRLNQDEKLQTRISYCGPGHISIADVLQFKIVVSHVLDTSLTSSLLIWRRKDPECKGQIAINKPLVVVELAWKDSVIWLQHALGKKQINRE
ncbi:hypothetical protein NPIL_131021 [Nephila pilipes]|uniref:Uncharacterized protein n=1 Tax=Nephila pilipes TaxID=299642 RepID=A0A8X6PTS6_NEPPI|nr:hypothetical protein NPIL_131021 [Nephila pilipes]